MRAILLAAALLPAWAPPAAGQPVIDDFESGSFQLAHSNPATPAGTSVALSVPGHAIATPRHVQIDPGSSGPPAMTAEVAAGSEVDDALKITFAPGGGEALIWYHVAPESFDLAAGGVNDRIEIRIPVATPGAGLQVNVWDLAGSSASIGMGVGLGVHRVYFTDLAPVDFSQVKRLEIRIFHFVEGILHVADVRAMREDTRWLRFEIPLATLIGPPFPLDPCRYDVLDETPSDRQTLRLLAAFDPGSGAAAPLALTAMDSGGDSGAGPMGGIGVSWNNAAVPVAATAFDLRIDIDALSGIDPQPFMTMLPAVTPTATGFMLAFEVFHPGDAGEVARITDRQILVDAFPGQDLRLEDVQVQAVAGALPAALAAAGEPPAAFRVTFTLEPGDVDPGEPLFEVSLTGTCRPAATTAVDSAPPAAQSLAAWPGITRGGTDLRLSRPAATPGRIDLFDVSGRRVHGFAVAAGETGRHWDGRDTGGAMTPAGLYFSRFIAPGTALVARIVRLP